MLELVKLPSVKAESINPGIAGERTVCVLQCRSE